MLGKGVKQNPVPFVAVDGSPYLINNLSRGKDRKERVNLSLSFP